MWNRIEGDGEYTEAQVRFNHFADMGWTKRQEIELWRTELPQSHILADIKVTSPKRFALPSSWPGQWYTPFTAQIPFDYFPDSVHPEETPDLIRYLMKRGFFSLKSKSAQAGMHIFPDFRNTSNQTYQDWKITEDENGYSFPLRVMNLNPYNPIEIPQEPTELFRFFIPSRKIVGYPLFEIAQNMGVEGLMMSDRFGRREYDLEKLANKSPYDRLFHPNFESHLSTVVLPVVREADYTTGRSLDWGAFQAISHSKRADVDQALGLQWGEVGQFYEPDTIGSRVFIGETDPFQMPNDVLGVITTTRDFGDDINMLVHIGSPLIDPGFGQNVEGGLPVRVERWIAGILDDPSRRIKMDFYAK